MSVVIDTFWKWSAPYRHCTPAVSRTRENVVVVVARFFLLDELRWRRLFLGGRPRSPPLASPENGLEEGGSPAAKRATEHDGGGEGGESNERCWALCREFFNSKEADNQCKKYFSQWYKGRRIFFH